LCGRSRRRSENHERTYKKFGHIHSPRGAWAAEKGHAGLHVHTCIALAHQQRAKGSDAEGSDKQVSGSAGRFDRQTIRGIQPLRRARHDKWRLQHCEKHRDGSTFQRR
jgi:hypothetical protein